MFNPESILERDEYYENSILREILRKEGEDYPQSFDDLSLKVIDIMEYLMFYLDSFKVVLKIFDKVQVTLWIKSQILSVENNAEAHQELVSRLQNTDRTLREVLDSFIQGGTKGLSKWPAISDTIDTLKSLHSQIYDIHMCFQWIIDRLPKLYPHPGSILLKDEHHFLKVVEYFMREFGGLIVLFERDIIHAISNLPEIEVDHIQDLEEEFPHIGYNHNQQAKIDIITSFIELKAFIDLDSILKSEFFQRINLFSFRFIFEDLITKLLEVNSDSVIR